MKELALDNFWYLICLCFWTAVVLAMFGFGILIIRELRKAVHMDDEGNIIQPRNGKDLQS